MIKFNKYNVTNGSVKVRVSYNLDNRVDGRSCITIYAKDYDNQLHTLFPDSYKNDTDMRSDYFEQGKVTLFEDHQLYKTAREFVEKLKEGKGQK
jgi:hypothetical protein